MSELKEIVPNLESLSPAELRELIEKAKKLADTKEISAKDEGVAKITTIAAEIGATVTIKFGGESPAKKNRGTRPITHRNPLNEKEVWRGMGPKPDWLKAKLAAGESLDSFKV